MATSALKSTSRERNIRTSSKSTKQVPNRRSRSVSAFPRNPSNLSSQFSIQRDNPLFWSSEINSQFEGQNSKVSSNGAVADRGRSVSRNGKETDARALSRVDMGRRGRSISRPPVMMRSHYVNSESEVDQECSLLLKNCRNRNVSCLAANVGKKSNAVRSGSAKLDGAGQHPSFDSLDDSGSTLSCSEVPKWEDAVSHCSFSGVEEKTIKPVCEEEMKPFLGGIVGDDTSSGGLYESVRSKVRRAISDIQNDLEGAIRRINAASIRNTNIADIPLELVNPGAVELILDIRNEYAKKLEQSHKRARKLRADLEVEEHHGQELSRILKEILMVPKTPPVQKFRLGRKASIVKRKMSKRLTEEAMAYFDEYVSLSTFDSSDFLSPEDQPLNSVVVSLTQSSTCSTATYYPNNCLNERLDKEEFDMHGQATLTSDKASPSNTTNAAQGLKFQFSFAHKTTESIAVGQGIRNYVKNFEKEIEKDDVNS